MKRIIKFVFTGITIFICILFTHSYNEEYYDDLIAPGGYYSEGENTIIYNNSTKSFHFYYNSSEEQIEYIVKTTSVASKKGLIKVQMKYNNNEKCTPIYQGGLRFRYHYLENDIIYPIGNKFEGFNASYVWYPKEFAQKAQTEFFPYPNYPQHYNFNCEDKDGDGVIDEVWVRYKEQYFDRYNEYTWIYLIKEYHFMIKGKTLIIQMKGGKDPDLTDLGYLHKADCNYAGIDFGRSKGTNNIRAFTMPYVELTPVSVVDNKYFYSIYTEHNKSYGSRISVRKQRRKITKYINSPFGISVPIGEEPDPDSIYCFNHCSYNPNTNEIINPYSASLDETYLVDEEAYLTVSDNVLDVLPVIENDPTTIGPDPSPYYDVVKENIVFHLYGYSHQYGNWDILLKRYHHLGLEDLIVIGHSWMKHKRAWGYPDFYPARHTAGSLEEFEDISNIISNVLKYRFAVYTNYYCIFPDKTFPDNTVKDNKYWVSGWEGTNGSSVPFVDNIFVSKNKEWKWRYGWYNLWNDIPIDIAQRSFAIIPDRMNFYCQDQTPLIKGNYNVNAVFNDVHAAHMPNSDYSLVSLKMDFNERNIYSSTFRQLIEYNKDIFQYQKNIYQGPSLGEGRDFHKTIKDYPDECEPFAANDNCFQTFYAGYVDSTFSAPRTIHYDPNVAGNLPPIIKYPVIPDYEIKRVKPQLINHGMSHYNRFFGLNIDEFKHIQPELCNWNYWFSLIIAYNHSGNLKQNLSYKLSIMNYFLLREVQRLYLNSNIISIEYHNNGEWKDLNRMILESQEFEWVRIREKFENGLHLWVNFSQNDWSITIPKGTFIIPKYGWLAYSRKTPYSNDNPFLEFYGKEDGEQFNYYFVKSNNYTFIQSIFEVVRDGYKSSNYKPSIYFGENPEVTQEGNVFLVSNRTIPETRWPGKGDNPTINRFMTSIPLDYNYNNSVTKIYSQEYSEGILNNPWDMNDSGDISVQGFSSSQFLNGIWSGITDTSFSHSIELSILQEKPIDLKKYYQFSFRLYSEYEGIGNIIVKNINNISYESDSFVISPGWNYYKFNLQQLNLKESILIDYNIPVSEIKIDIHTGVGCEVRLDCLKLKIIDDYFSQHLENSVDFYNKFDVLNNTTLLAADNPVDLQPGFDTWEINNNKFIGNICEEGGRIYLNVKETDFWDIDAKTRNTNYYIDTKRYYNLNIRMFSDVSGEGKLYFRNVGWNKIGDTWKIDIKPEKSISFNVFEGLNTYSIDLSEYTFWVNKKPQILSIGFPTGANVEIEWISLECPDEYADAALQTFWDMEKPGKIAKYYFKNAIGFSDDGITENGYLSLETDLADAELVLNISDAYKVNSEKYSVLKFRMSSSFDTSGKITWETENGDIGQINIDNIYLDWHTYIIDLKESPDYKDKIVTMSFFPSVMLGNEIEIDYIRLLSPEGAVGYTNEYKDFQIVAWGRDSGIRVDIDGFQTCAVVAPSIIELPDSSYRMYYDKGGCPYGWSRRIASAASTDGINWTKEGVVKFSRMALIGGILM